LKKFVLSAFVLVSMAIAVPMSGSASALGTKRVVDDDFGGSDACKNAGYATLAAAVAAASDGDDIIVCAGTYAGGVTINKQLTITGTDRFTRGPKKRCFNETKYPGTGNGDSVINGGLTIAHDNVTVDAVTIQGAAAGVTVQSGVNHFTLHGSALQSNTIGMYLSGSNHEIMTNCFRHNNLAGAASGNGIYADQGLDSPLIAENYFNDHASSGINLVGPSGGGSGPITNVDILQNWTIDDSDFVSMIGTDGTIVDQNIGNGGTTLGDDGAIVYIQSGNTDFVITRNTFKQGDDEGINIDADGGTQNTGGLIVGNNLTKFPNTAIVAAADSIDNSEFRGNFAKKNTGHGLGIEDGNTGNLVTGNRLNQNTGVDCWDATDPIANTWTDSNRGDEQNHPNMCGPKAVTVP
jgi:Right handed beta helix region